MDEKSLAFEMTASRVGILGAGQLAKMLAEAGEKLGLQVSVLAQSPKDPAAQVCKFSIGSLRDRESLSKFLIDLDCVAFENEFLDMDSLKWASTQFPKARILPSPAILEALQDKLSQKKLLDELKLKTAPWKLDSQETSGIVMKWSRMGYDGKGVLVLSSPDEKKAAAFRSEGEGRGAVVFTEKLIPYKRELAVVGIRNEKGEFIHYPLVQSLQEKAVCYLVTGPAISLGNSSAQEKEAAEVVEKIANHLKYVGVLAVEFFETPDGVLWVNEIAPRVHNSGHFSMDASHTSQFENHWRALLGMALGSTKSKPAFAMLNLLGPDGVARKGIPPPTSSKDFSVHWYGKEEARPGRKLGHLNGVTSLENLNHLIESLKDSEKAWIASLRRG